MLRSPCPRSSLGSPDAPAAWRATPWCRGRHPRSELSWTDRLAILDLRIVGDAYVHARALRRAAGITPRDLEVASVCLDDVARDGKREAKPACFAGRSEARRFERRRFRVV